MTIGESGQSLAFSALRTEFVGGSSAISLSDLYRGGSNIRTKHPGNPLLMMLQIYLQVALLNLVSFMTKEKDLLILIQQTLLTKT